MFFSCNLLGWIFSSNNHSSTCLGDARHTCAPLILFRIEVKPQISISFAQQKLSFARALLSQVRISCATKLQALILLVISVCVCVCVCVCLVFFQRPEQQ